MTTAIVYGVGAMGALIARFMLERGVTIVGAIDANPALVGQDLGAVLGLEEPLGVIVSDDAEAVLGSRTDVAGAVPGRAGSGTGGTQPSADIAVLALFSQADRMEPFVLRCVERGINVISTSRELSHPWSVAPESAARIDSAAREHGVTVSASGFQDTFMVNLVSMLTGACQEVRRIELRSRYDVNDFGAVVARDMCVGQEPARVAASIVEAGPVPSFGLFCIEAGAADLGLRLTDVHQETRPLVDDVPVHCRTLGVEVAAGLVTGLTEVVTAKGLPVEVGGVDDGSGGPGSGGGRSTAVEFFVEWTGKALAPGQEPFNECAIKGLPDVYSQNAPVDHSITTATQVVNRIPDVISAPPGFVTYERLPKLKFRPQI